MVPGALEDAEFDVAKECIVRGEERQIDRDALWHGGIGQACGNAGTVGRGGDLCAKGREGRRALGMVHRCQECRPCVRQRPTAPEPVTSRAQLGGVDRGWWEHTAAPELGNLWGIDRVVCGLPAVDGLQREGMTEDESDALVGTQVSEPVPGAQARDGHDETLSRRGQSVQEGLRVGLHGAVHEPLAALVENADVHGTGVEVDAAGKWVLGRVESPCGLLLVRDTVFPLSADHDGLLGRGPQ